MATKFKSPKRWDDYQMNKALCFVVLAVISCVILLGFASASLTSYFAQVNANKNGYVYSYSYTATVGDTDPNLDIDGFFVDSYHYNTTITTTLKSSDYSKFTYLRLEVNYSNLIPVTNYAKLKIPKDGTFCVLSTVNSQYSFNSLPTCTLDDALMWSSCETSNCPSNVDWDYFSQQFFTYFYIYPRQPLDNEINIEFQFFGNFDTANSESSVNVSLFITYFFLALALVIPFVLLVAAIVAKKLRKPFPVDEPDDDATNSDNNNKVVDEFSGEELSTFSK